MNSLKTMYGCGLNFFIKLAYNSLFLYKFVKLILNSYLISIWKVYIFNTTTMQDGKNYLKKIEVE